LQVDPIEKKPLNHFLPGTRVFSLGTAGCNMGCFFCQNWDISKSKADQVRSQAVAAEDVPLLALKYECDSIAFTYNEPTIWGEYVIDICKAAREHGLKTVMVSNGYVTREAFHDIYEHVDAANIDLKAFTENFYGKITLTHLDPVLETLRWLKEKQGASVSTLPGRPEETPLQKREPIWFEITNLMIPGLNDDPGETRRLAEWILRELGPDVPLHFTAFHPDFKLKDRGRTPAATLDRAREIAREVGLNFVYEGNIFTDAANTFCPGCGVVLIRRSWHDVVENRIVEGKCFQCGVEIAGRWDRGGVVALKANPGVARRYAHLNL
jgi:pyruvate formate lyase activating enzyme